MKTRVITKGTGTPALDEVLGLLGLPVGRIVEVSARPGAAQQAVAEILHRQIAAVQVAGHVAAVVDLHHRLDVRAAERHGVKLDGLLVSQPDSHEQAVEVTDTLIASGAVDLIAVDWAPVPPADGFAQQAQQARLFSALARRLCAHVHRHGVTALFLVEPQPARDRCPLVTALKFYASIRIEVVHRDGGALEIGCVKNKCAQPFLRAALPSPSQEDATP